MRVSYGRGGARAGTLGERITNIVSVVHAVGTSAVYVLNASRV